ncbi:TIR domain-containing protein [Longimicrobium sp.]|uniref:TIR domain-containing protein n=1 Tax=Longimicrobium sp. TaxID=2029185 RepID=UPI003B3A4C88
MSSDIFISYARKDRERVRPIADELARLGYTIWWDTGLVTGEDFHERIEEMLEGARIVVVVWSRNSVDSKFVRDEARRAERRGALLPVFIDPAIDPPLGLGEIQASDLSGWLLNPANRTPFEQFTRDVAAVLGREPSPRPLPAPPSPPPAAVLLWRRPAFLAIAGVVVAAMLVLGFLSFNEKSGGATEIVADSTPADARVAGGGAEPAPPDTLPVQAQPRTDMLVGFQCALPGQSRNPLGERAERHTPSPYRVTADHVLVRADGQPVRLVQAGSVGDTLRDRRLIVANFTAMPARGVEAYFEGDVRASAHLLIRRDGSVTQLVPFDIVAFHAGQSRWKELTSLNRYSIGIEMENLGLLRQREGAWYFQENTRVPADSVERFAGANGRVQGWHAFTDAQIQSFFQVSCALRRAYPTIEDVVGHEDISPGRKIDPGPAFPLAAVRARLFPPR